MMWGKLLVNMTINHQNFKENKINIYIYILVIIEIIKRKVIFKIIKNKKKKK